MLFYLLWKLNFKAHRAVGWLVIIRKANGNKFWEIICWNLELSLCYFSDNSSKTSEIKSKPSCTACLKLQSALLMLASEWYSNNLEKDWARRTRLLCNWTSTTSDQCSSAFPWDHWWHSSQATVVFPSSGAPSIKTCQVKDPFSSFPTSSILRGDSYSCILSASP